MGNFDQLLLQNAINGDQGAQDQIIRQLEPMILSISSNYHLTGGDHEDLCQEARVAVTKALRSYDAQKNDSFAAYAAICIKNAMQSAVKSDQRQKAQVLNTAVEYNDQLGLAGDSAEKVVLRREQMLDVNTKIRQKLSPLEKQALMLFADGYSYKEIAARMNINTKAVDNALARVRAKLQ